LTFNGDWKNLDLSRSENIVDGPAAIQAFAAVAEEWSYIIAGTVLHSSRGREDGKGKKNDRKNVARCVPTVHARAPRPEPPSLT
jgi:hypothetical protein